MKAESEELIKGLGPVALVFTMVIGATVMQSAFNTPRPDPGTPIKQPRVDNRLIEARLWQDPLQAIQGHDNRYATPIETIQEKTQRKDVVVLAVMVYGDSYASSVESRFRKRYAIQAALGTERYIPKDNKHLRFIEFPISTDEVDLPEDLSVSQGNSEKQNTIVSRVKKNTKGCKTFNDRTQPKPINGKTNTTTEARPDNTDSLLQPVLNIPFEWFERDVLAQSADTKSILVLWINENAIKNRTAKFLRDLANTLKYNGKSVENDNDTRPALVVLGPQSSGTLIHLRKSTGSEQAEDDADLNPENHPNIQMISSGTTAPLEVIDLHTENESSAKWLDGFTVNLINASDWQLVNLLVDELDNRGIDLKKDEILLVSEWDTLYGRSLPFLFKLAMPQAAHPSLQLETAETTTLAKQIKHEINNPTPIFNLFQIRYLRGLDGALPNSKSAKKENSKTNKPQIEWAVGPTQLDYLRRMSNQIETPPFQEEPLPSFLGVIEEQFRHLQLPKHTAKAWPTRIRAVGVLGSDFYDKLVVIQALRKKYPEAVFFTTDLDARVFHPSQIGLTKNLIVASGYGFTLTNTEEMQYQADLPPFRSSYQTAAYLACRYAVRQAGPNLKQHPIIAPPPRLFEIGRTKPIDITPKVNESVGSEIGSKPHRGRSFTGNYTTVHPSTSNIQGPTSRQRLYIALIALIALILLMIATGTFWPFITEWYLSKFMLLALTAAFIAIGFRMYLEMIDAQETGLDEPITFVSGVSVWPTEFLRLLAAYLATAGICYAASRLDNAKGRLGKEFCLNTRKPLRVKMLRRALGEQAASPLIRQMKHQVDSWKSDEILMPKNRDFVNVRLVWMKYRLLGNCLPRLVRSLLVTGAFILSIILIMSLMGWPYTPARGKTSDFWNETCLKLSVASFLLLTFFISDAIRLCSQFIRTISKDPAQWPQKTIEKFKDGTNISDNNLLSSWLTIDLIAKQTAAVTPLIYLPFVIVTVMIVSRSPYLFDRWAWPIQLVVVIGASILFATLTSFVLRRDAEQARKIILNRLSINRLQADLDDRKNLETEVVSDHIRETREGAFAPFFQTSVIRAIVVAFGGYSGIVILELMAKSLNY